MKIFRKIQIAILCHHKRWVSFAWAIHIGRIVGYGKVIHVLKNQPLKASDKCEILSDGMAVRVRGIS